MNINAAIIDQRLSAVCDDIREQARDDLNINQEGRLKSLAFVYLCVKTMLDLTDEEAFDCLTEGGGDFGIDAIHFSEVFDGEFTVTIFQGKYKNDLEGTSNFPQSGIDDMIQAISYIFDPGAQLNTINDRLKAKVEEVRSLVRDGNIPQVRALACNNGMEWNNSAQEDIDRAGFGDQVSWEHVNHDRLVMILQSTKKINDTLNLTGKGIVEDFNYSRVLIARISVLEIAALMERHGERLLERNIRRFLGLKGNRVNEGIKTTLKQESNNFYFFNNGITMTCDKFSYNALQDTDYIVKVENLQIINGAQTCMTIRETLNADQPGLNSFNNGYVLIRLYQLPSDNEDIVQRITYATNSQNPVDLRDLHANDDIQQRLQLDIKQLGYTYQRKRSDKTIKSTDITSGVVAEAVLSVWRGKPHKAKFFAREHFGTLYETIFKDLNGAQAIIATLIYRIAENRRRRPQEHDPQFVRYASCFIAMQMGKYLLKDMDCTIADISHRNFTQAKELVEEKGTAYFDRAVADIQKAINDLYKNPDVSLQQLSATFRRGDLIEKLT